MEQGHNHGIDYTCNDISDGSCQKAVFLFWVWLGGGKFVDFFSFL